MMKRAVWFLAVCLCAGARADVVLSGLFSDGAVLQRGQPVPVWGSASPGEEVTVEFGGQRKSAVASPDGRWVVQLEPMSASAEPRSMSVSGSNRLTISDVLVGEVWLCAGQSNMAMALAESDNAAEVMKQGDLELRAFRVPERAAEQPWSTVNGSWLAFQPKTAGHWSATPYFIGRRLREELQVPVGVIVCAWGGSSAVTWMSAGALQRLDGLVPEEVTGWRSNIQPSKLYNGMLHPLAPYAIAGVTWYQGETDGEPYMNAYIYRQLFPAMIRDWRDLWARAELPFYWVQLPNLRNKPRWPILRESQAAALNLPATGMVPTLDIGRENDLHPKNKQEFGNRIGDVILAKSYQRKTWSGAPTYEEMEVDGETVRIRVANAEGLKTSDGQAPKGFLIAGEDGKFVPAEAEIEKESLIVSSPAVKAPKAVRYAWDGNPSVNVVNNEGLPLVPFRTDEFFVEGQEWGPVPLPGKATLPILVKGAELANEAKPWSLNLKGIEADDVKKFRALQTHGDMVQIAFSGDRRGGMTSESPALFWETPVASTRELTVQATVQMYRATDPFRGFDLEAVVRQTEGGFRRYLISIVPMRVYAFQGKEIRLLASNLDNMTEPHRYRMAIRGDGVAQVYFDDRLIGLTSGEDVSSQDLAASSIRVGKQRENGEFTANLHEASYDAATAYGP